jgi:hypothetical protein
MSRTPPRASKLAAALMAAGLALGANSAAAACLSAPEIRAAVQAGQVMPLRNVIAGVIASVGGEIVGVPSLCNEGGQLVYHFNVLSGGRTIPVQVDGRSGQVRY